MFEYYVNYSRRNTTCCYSLFCVSKAESKQFLACYPEAQRITRAEAVSLARAERKRRKESPAFSGYADTYVMPFPGAWCNPFNAYLHTASDGVTVYPV